MGKKCLLVSVEPYYQEGYTNMLKTFGIETEIVWDIKSVLESSNKEEYVLIILDAVKFDCSTTCEQLFLILEEAGIPYMIEGSMENWPQNISLKNYLGKLGSVAGSIAISLGCKIHEQEIRINENNATEIGSRRSVDIFSEYPFLNILKEKGII